MKRSNGFSLVELMVVVGIMGVLVSIALPRFQTYQARSKRTEAISLLSQIFTLMTANYNEFGTYKKNHKEQITLAASEHYGRADATSANCAFSTASKWPSQIGFSISPCNSGVSKEMPFYAYWLNKVTDTEFLAIAEAPTGVVNKCKTGSFNDELSIKKEKEIKIRIDGVNCVKGSENTNIALGTIAGGGGGGG